MHYFNLYAVKDRIPIDHPLTLLLHSHNPHDASLSSLILPSAADDASMSTNMSILISRIVAKHMPFFKTSFEDVVEWHIDHPFKAEMSRKSEIVGIILCGLLKIMRLL